METHGDTRNESASWCQVRLQTNALEHCAWEHDQDQDWMDVVVGRRERGGDSRGHKERVSVVVPSSAPNKRTRALCLGALPGPGLDGCRGE